MFCLMRGYLQRDSSFLPIGIEVLHSRALLAPLLLDIHTEERSSSKPTLRDVWKNVIQHPSTQDCHHSQTQRQNVTGRIHTHTHTHTQGLAPITSTDPHRTQLSLTTFGWARRIQPLFSLPFSFLSSLPLPFLPCVVFFEERVLVQKL